MILAAAAFQATTIPGLHRQLSLEAVVIGVAIVLMVILLVWRILQGRNLKKRRAASESYFDADAAHLGSGPAGFSDSTATPSADPTLLAPSFDSTSAPARPGGRPTGDFPLPKAASPPAPFIPPSGVAEAGWLPDPSGDPTVLRYWDGTAWTGHTAERS
ncbi:MAG TPA: DUF2510 domain-containing protein [Acidimicrobiales bacterium]|nr:DUF2510 domain-containing protein [Acidimicrobiales bacterium]